MNSVEINLLQENHLSEAEKLLKQAFGTFLKLPNPMDFGHGAEYRFRWYREHSGDFVATIDGKIAGFSMAANWGSYAGFGPIVVDPNYWDSGIGAQLMMASVEKFEEWRSTQISFCTHSHSPKHFYFYAKFGFLPRFLIAVFNKKIAPQAKTLTAQRYSLLSVEQQAESLKAAYELTDQIYSGLDWTSEITVVEKLSLGDTLLLWDDMGLVGFAICHFGTHSEAETDSCYIKIGVAKSAQVFEELLDESEALTTSLNLSYLSFGIETACDDAYQRILNRKYQIQFLMASMYKPNQFGYARPDTYIIDDRR